MTAPRTLVLMLIVAAASPAVMANQLDAAQACASEPQRLKRLACFDEVFGTPIENAEASLAPEMHRPERWRQAYAQAVDSRSVVYRDTGQVAGHLVTVPALGARPPRPLLVLQCHNNITELALMLPEAVRLERVEIGIGGARSDWRVRDNGFLISGGRGLPAIRTVKSIESAPDISLQANGGDLDGLVFDLSGFNGAIRPLRAACGW